MGVLTTGSKIIFIIMGVVLICEFSNMKYDSLYTLWIEGTIALASISAIVIPKTKSI